MTGVCANFGSLGFSRRHIFIGVLVFFASREKSLCLIFGLVPFASFKLSVCKFQIFTLRVSKFRLAIQNFVERMIGLLLVRPGSVWGGVRAGGCGGGWLELGG